MVLPLLFYSSIHMSITCLKSWDLLTVFLIKLFKTVFLPWDIHFFLDGHSHWAYASVACQRNASYFFISPLLALHWPAICCSFKCCKTQFLWMSRHSSAICFLNVIHWMQYCAVFSGTHTRRIKNPLRKRWPPLRPTLMAYWDSSRALICRIRWLFFLESLLWSLIKPANSYQYHLPCRRIAI